MFLYTIFYYYLLYITRRFLLWQDLTSKESFSICIFNIFIVIINIYNSYNYLEIFSGIFILNLITFFVLLPSYDIRAREKNNIISFLVKNDSNITIFFTIFIFILNFNSENYFLLGLISSIFIFEINWRRYFNKICDKKYAGCDLFIMRNENKNLPECCYENLNNFYKDFIIFLNKTKISYWLDGGTLVGYYRDKKLLKWDDDIDIGFIMEDEFDWKKVCNLVHEFCEENNYIYERYDNLKRFVIIYNGYYFKPFKRQSNRNKNNIKLDFVGYFVKDGLYQRYDNISGKSNLRINEKYLHPLKETEMLDLKTKVPNDVVSYLNSCEYEDIDKPIRIIP